MVACVGIAPDGALCGDREGGPWRNMFANKSILGDAGRVHRLSHIDRNTTCVSHTVHVPFMVGRWVCVSPTLRVRTSPPAPSWHTCSAERTPSSGIPPMDRGVQRAAAPLRPARLCESPCKSLPFELASGDSNRFRFSGHHLVGEPGTTELNPLSARVCFFSMG